MFATLVGCPLDGYALVGCALVGCALVGCVSEMNVTEPENRPVFQQLMEVIENRRSHPSEKSYTTKLLNGGVEKIGAKVLEEAAEVVEAAGEPGADGRQHLVYEAADLLYHLFVMLGHREIGLNEVEAELARRFGISGLEEKASRPPKSEE